MTPTVVILILAGAGVGLGLFLIVREFTPGVPALGPALRQLHAPTSVAGHPLAANGALGWIGARLRVPHRELALIGHSTERYVTEKVGFALVGLLFPPAFSLILALSGIRLGIVIPAAVGLALAVLFFFLVDVSVRQRAAEAREEFSRHVAVYLD